LTGSPVLRDQCHPRTSKARRPPDHQATEHGSEAGMTPREKDNQAGGSRRGPRLGKRAASRHGWLRKNERQEKAPTRALCPRLDLHARGPWSPRLRINLARPGVLLLPAFRVLRLSRVTLRHSAGEPAGTPHAASRHGWLRKGAASSRAEKERTEKKRHRRFTQLTRPRRARSIATPAEHQMPNAQTLTRLGTRPHPRPGAVTSPSSRVRGNHDA
jgi:hypothetical protein